MVGRCAFSLLGYSLYGSTERKGLYSLVRGTERVDPVCLCVAWAAYSRVLWCTDTDTEYRVVLRKYAAVCENIRSEGSR